MTTVQEHLLSLLSNALFSIPTTASITPEITKEAQQQAVSTIISTDYRTLGSNIRVFNAHAKLTNILSGIPFTTFKGYASAFYYQDSVKRPMGDVDFIVEPRCFRETVERLEDAGWNVYSGAIRQRARRNKATVTEQKATHYNEHGTLRRD